MKKRFFYGWVIVAAGCAVMAIAMGMVSNAFGIFIVPICEEFQFTRQQMNFNQSLFMAGGMSVALFSGTIYRKLPVKWVLRGAALVLIAAYNLYPLASTLPVFYLLSSICAVTFALCTQVPLSIILNNWFHEKRGLAVGITFMGSGLGGMIFNALGGVLLPLVSWRGTFTVFGICLAVILIPCVFFLLKEKPEEMGLLPLGSEAENDVSLEAENRGATLPTMLKSFPFWILLLTTMLFGICLNSSNATMASHMTDSGYGSTGAATITAVYLGMLALGKIVLGALYDKWGLRRAMLFANCCIVAQFICMFLAKNPIFMVGATVFCGFGNSFGSVSYPVMARGIYGNREYATTTGLFMAANNLGSAIGPTLCGTVYDSFGSYRPAFLVMIFAVVGISLLTHWATARELRQNYPLQ